MATDYKITKIEKILSLDDELRHIHIEAVITDGILSKEYGIDFSSDKESDLSLQIEDWLIKKRQEFEEFSSNKSVIEIWGDHKVQTLDPSLFVIDKNKILNAVK